MVVIDASVAAKWFLIELDSQDALKILSSDMKLVGPTLAKYEVAGAFTRRAKDKQITVDDAESYMDRWGPLAARHCHQCHAIGGR